MRILGCFLVLMVSVTSAFGQEFSIPETLEYSLGDVRGIPKVVSTGATELIYRGFSDDGNVVPPGSVGNDFYLVAARPGVYRIFAWEKAAPGKAKQCIITLAGDGGGNGGGTGLSEPENLDPKLKGLAGRIGVALKEDQADSDIRRKDALMLFMLFGQLAELFERDGERTPPKYVTIPDASEKLKGIEIEVLKGTRLDSLAKGYPTVSNEAGKAFIALFGEVPEKPPAMTPEDRQRYVLMLRTISIGAAAVAWE